VAVMVWAVMVRADSKNFNTNNSGEFCIDLSQHKIMICHRDISLQVPVMSEAFELLL